MKALLFYRDFTKVSSQFSHVGLGISAYMLKEVLAKHNIKIDIFGVSEANDIAKVIAKNTDAKFVIIEAPWVDPRVLEDWIKTYPLIQFVVRCHSQIDFLVVEPGAIWQLRKEIEFQKTYPNFKLGTNSTHLKSWFDSVFGINSLYLPNLYHKTEPFNIVKDRDFNPLCIGSFGALRNGKNITSGAATAMSIARKMGTGLRFFVNVNRMEHGNGVLESLKAMFTNTPGMTLVQVPWSDWTEFKRTVSMMDLTIQLSHTETFCIVAADAINENVPVLGSSAIEWLPTSWKIGNTDDIELAAEIGIRLLEDRENALRNGHRALNESIEAGVHHWKAFLK